MADEPKPLFTIDAGKILAKLHLAAQQQVPNSLVINTAIKNPVAKGDPKNPGKVEFDFENKSGEYQIAIVKLLAYQIQIDLLKNKKLMEFQTQLDKYKKENDKAKLTDKTKDKDDSELKKIHEEMLKLFAGFKLPDYKEDREDFEASAKSFNEAVQKENEKRKTERKEAEEKLKSEAFEDMSKYYETFLGKDVAAKLSEDSVAIMPADSDGKLKDPAAFKNINDYKLDVESIAKDIEKVEEKAAEKPNEWLQRNIAFVAGYTVNIE